MPEVVKGRNIKVEIAATFGAPKTVSAVTLADPGVASSTSHGLTDGTVGYFSAVGGMVQLEGQAGRVDNPVTNAFDIQGLNTTGYSAFSGSANFTPAATWLTLSEATSYVIGGGAAEKLDVTTLVDVVKQEENGLLATQSVQIGTLAKSTLSAAMAKVASSAQSGSKLLWRITLNDGSVRVFYGEPSLPGENVQKGQVGTGSFDVSVKGLVLSLAP